MNRRDFSARLAALGLGSTAFALPHVASAQSFGENEYVRLSQPLAVEKGKIEVVEFFWYGCPHCYAFEPDLDAWQKKLPADVAFRRAPAAFREQQSPHQRLYYTLEAMGQVDALHRKVFQAIHGDRQRLDDEASILAFAVKNGLDGAKFKEVYNSFTVSTKGKQANRLADGYKIDGVPSIGIAGRFYTGPGKVTPQTLPQQTHARTLAVADFLIDKVRTKKA